MLKNPTLDLPAQHPPLQDVQAASAVMLRLPCPASQMKPRITPSATQRPQSRSVGPRRASRRVRRLRRCWEFTIEQQRDSMGNMGEIHRFHHSEIGGFARKHARWFHHQTNSGETSGSMGFTIGCLLKGRGPCPTKRSTFYMSLQNEEIPNPRFPVGSLKSKIRRRD